MSDVLEASACRAAEDSDAFAFPLLPHQLRLWHSANAQAGGRSQNIAFCLSLTGNVDAEVLRSTLNALTLRHEALRSTCAATDEGPVLVVSASGEAFFRVVDLRTHPVADVDPEVDRQCADEARRSFDLQSGPLARFVLIRATDTVSYLLMTFHQMIADGWSVALLMEEIATVYDEIARHGAPLTFAATGLQYGDYIAWYHDYLESPEALAAIGAQAARLHDYRRLDVAPDKPAEDDTGDCAIVTRELAPALTDAIASRNALNGDTMFMAAAAACLAVLHMSTGRCDLSVGTPVAQRHRNELEPVVGNLLDHTVLTAAVQPEMTLEDLLALARCATLDMLAADTMPLDSVSAAFEAQSGRRYDPFFSVCLSCQRAFGGGGTAMVHEFAGLRMATQPSKATGAVFDLFFFMVQRENGWRLSLDYRVSKFSEARAQALIEAFAAVLELIDKKPETRLCDLAFSSLHKPAAPVERAAETPGLARPLPEHSSDDTVLTDDEPFAGLASFAQERYWLLAKAMPGGSAFNMPARLRIRGTLSVDSLERSLQALVARHMILRTSFELSGEGLLQVVHPRMPLTLARQDLSGMPLEERKAALDLALSAEAVAPFEVERGPLVRARLICFDQNEHYLCLTLHHIISDGASIAILQRDLWALYDALAHGSTPDLADLPIQYIDYAGCQKQWAGTGAADLQFDYWTQRLKAPLPVQEIPTDHSAARRGTARPALIEHVLSPELVARLRDVCAREGATMFSVTAACFATLLSRLSGGEDVLFACPSDNREEQTTGVAGPFASLFVLRVDLRNDPQLSDLTATVSEAIMEAHANRNIPFERVVTEVNAPAPNGRNPLFQFFFLYQRAFLQPIALPSLTVEPLKSTAIGTPYELQVSVIERDAGTTVQLEYNTDLFDEPTVVTFLGDYVANLELRTTRPDLKLSELPDLRRSSGGRDASRPDTAYIAPKTDLERSIAACWRKVLRHEPVGLRDSFFDLGGNSFNVVALANEIRIATGLDVGIGALFAYPTIAAFVENLDELHVRPKSMVVPLQPNGTKPPIYCLSGIELYRDIALSIDPDQPVFGIYVAEEDEIALQLAEGKMPNIDLNRWASAYLEAILRLKRSGPFRLAGISAGGVLAMMVASSMVKLGLDVEAVFLFDTILADGYTRNRTQWLAERAREVRDGGVRRVTQRLSDVHWRRRGAAAASADPAAVTPRDVKVKAFSTAIRAWKPQDFHGTFKVVLYRALETLSNRRLVFQREYGWARLLTQPVIVEDFAGDHLSMVRAPSAAGIAASMMRHLEPAAPIARPQWVNAAAKVV